MREDVIQRRFVHENDPLCAVTRGLGARVPHLLHDPDGHISGVEEKIPENFLDCLGTNRFLYPKNLDNTFHGRGHLSSSQKFPSRRLGRQLTTPANEDDGC